MIFATLGTQTRGVERQVLSALERPQVQKAIKFAKKHRAGKLLDIGCAGGDITIALKEALGAEEVYGIEVSPQSAQAAQRRGIKVFQVDVDYSNLPFENDYFNAIFCGEIIEHLVNVERLLEEVRRVLKPGGFCILTTPNLAWWCNRIILLAGFQTYITWVPWGHFLVKGTTPMQLAPGEGRPHISVMSLRALKELISFHNLKIKRLEGASARADQYSFPLASLFYFWDDLISRIPSLANFIVVEIEKKPGDLI